MVSVAITQICCCSMEEAMESAKISGCGWVLIKLYLQTQTEEICSTGCSLLIPDVEKIYNFGFIDLIDK